MSRLPQIGDSVRRMVDGNVEFEGYVAGTTAACAGCIARDAAIDGDAEDPFDLTPDNDRRNVPIIDLVRSRFGWRWAPFDGRPQVGDVLVHSEETRLTDRMLIKRMNQDGSADAHLFVVGSVPPTLSAWSMTVSAADIAKAIAGLDGWSWEPARWSAP